MKNPVAKLMLPLLLGAMAAQAYLPYPERQLKYPRIPSWDAKLTTIWNGWKIRFVSNGLVLGNDPAGNKKSISEGQSYALLMAVWMNDQSFFNTVWTATENTFWNSSSGWYRWTPSDPNFAGDADIDICGALIFASALVDSGYWTNATVGGNTYKAKAKIVLASIIKNFIDVNSNYRVNSWPGAGDNIRNPSYHMPQWYQIFQEFGAANGVTGMDWTKARAGAYALLNAQTNSQWGMARNFSNGSGGAPSGGTSTPNPYDMGFDAIRVPYRIGMAALWYNQSEALAYGNKVWTAGKVDPTKPGMYAINGTLWGYEDANAQYEKFLPRAMWGTLAVGVQSTSAASMAARDAIVAGLGSAMSGNSYFDGLDADTTKASSAAQNYFGQSLGLMGGLAMAGRAWNVWDDLKNKWVVPDTAASVTKAMSATPTTIPVAVSGNIQKTSVTVNLSKAVKWTIHVRGLTSGASYDTSATSSNIELQWSTNMRNVGTTAKFAGEQVKFTLAYPGGDSTKAAQNTTITVQNAIGVGPRAIRGLGAVRAVEGGLLVEDAALSNGRWDRATLRNLQGREVLSVSVRDAGVAEQSVFVPSSLVASGTMVLEIHSALGGPSLRYLVAPTR